LQHLFMARRQLFLAEETIPIRIHLVEHPLRAGSMFLGGQ
jgi:hypothetical protein